MAFTIKRKFLITFAWPALLASFGHAAATTIGLATRDQNPMLQAYYLPSIEFSTRPGWQFSHSLFITNTYQTESINNETLVIDVENYRYDFSIAYQQDDWRLSTKIPLIFNQGGSLDGLIEDWHDFWGLPEGGRNANPDNQLNIEYIKNGQLIFLQNQADNDVGDISVSLSYRLAGNEEKFTEVSLGIELPTGSVETNSGNEATDVAIWLSHKRDATELTSLYGLIGYSRLGKGGQLSEQLASGTWVAQLGAEHHFTSNITGIVQFDMHSPLIKDSMLKAFGNSLQMQAGLQFGKLIQNHDLVLFFSEDILAGSAPDITFGARLSSHF
jgi:hypothetical protein